MSGPAPQPALDLVLALAHLREVEHQRDVANARCADLAVTIAELRRVVDALGGAAARAAQEHDALRARVAELEASAADPKPCEAASSSAITTH